MEPKNSKGAIIGAGSVGSIHAYNLAFKGIPRTALSFPTIVGKEGASQVLAYAIKHARACAIWARASLRDLARASCT